MATPAAQDVPVETGHDLILSTLLVHFDADEIDQLPQSLQPVVKDVYDVAHNLAETKVKYQCEMAQMRLELKRARAELELQRSRCETASDEAATAPRTATQSATTVTMIDPRCANTPAKRTTATQTRKRLSPPPLHGSLVDKIGQPLEKLSTPAARVDESAFMRRASVPLRNFVLDSTMTVANVGSPDEKRRSTLTMASRVQPQWPSAPASTGSLQAAPAEKPAKAAKSAPGKASSTTRASLIHQEPSHSDQTVRACLVLQLTSEHRLLAIQAKLNQLIQWKSEYADGFLRVCVGSTGSVIKGVRSHSVEEIEAALNALQDEATELLDGCTQVLDRVPDSSGDKQWLRDRHGVLETIVMQLDEWFVDVAVVLDALPSNPAETKRRSPISVRVWSDVKMTLGYVNATTIKVDELRKKEAMPSRLCPALTEFAVCSFVAQAIGVFSVSCVRGENYATLTHLGMFARDLEWLVDRSTTAQTQAADDGNVEQWRVAKSSKIFELRHATSLKALQRRATVCSEAICGVPSRIRGTVETSYAFQSMNTKHTRFPASMYTWAYYDDMVLSIVSCHVTLTRVVNVPPADRAAALLNIIKRLDELIEAMAPWVDPRFRNETDTRSFERREYVKLMDWCERMCGHVARFDIRDE